MTNATANVKNDKEFPPGTYEFTCNGIITGIDVYGTISKDYTIKDCAQRMIDRGGDLYDGIELSSFDLQIVNVANGECWNILNPSEDSLCLTIDNEECCEDVALPKIDDNCYIHRNPEDFDDYEFSEEYEFKDGFKLSDIKFFVNSFHSGRNILGFITIKDFEFYFCDAAGSYDLEFFIEGKEIDPDDLEDIANNDDPDDDVPPQTPTPPPVPPTPPTPPSNSGGSTPLADLNASLKASLEESQKALQKQLQASRDELKKSLDDALKGLKI